MSVNYNTVTWLQYTLDNVFNPGHDIKKYILIKHTIIAVMTICVEACFQARPSNKNICFVIFVLGNIDVWLHHNKIFSFKIKKSIVARYEYIMNSLKIPSTIESWNYFGSVGQLLKPQNICSGNIIQV